MEKHGRYNGCDICENKIRKFLERKSERSRIENVNKGSDLLECFLRY
jgi:hypothetical protein